MNGKQGRVQGWMEIRRVRICLHHKEICRINKESCDELIAFFTFTTLRVFDMTVGKKTILYAVNKTIRFERFHCCYYRWEGFMKFDVEIASFGMIYIRSFIKIGSGIQVILKLLPQQFERLQCWYCRWYEYMKHAVDGRDL